MTESTPVVVADDLSIRFPSRDVRSRLVAVNGVSFTLGAGEILGVVGGSGSGKSTLAATLGLHNYSGGSAHVWPQISGGSLRIFDTEVRRISRHQRDRLRLSVGYLAQDGAERLDARLTVAENVAEPIYSRDRHFSSREAGIAVATLIDAVRLPLGLMASYPYELSSGQRQRVALARALVLEPKLLIADELTRGVDAVVRAGTLSVLKDLRDERGFSAIIVSSDLSVVEQVSERMLVLYRGAAIGLGTTFGVLSEPIHPYLMALADSRFDKVNA
ncbi:MAG: ATP-binding cassette domain-containing protein [Terrimesophilobacter sp.]